jgi:hypothetical protein
VTSTTGEEPRTGYVHTQVELHEKLLDARFGDLEHIVIDAPSEVGMLRLNNSGTVPVSIEGRSQVHVTGHARADVRDQTAVFASQYAHIHARNQARVIAVDHATVEATDHATVEGHDQTSVVLRGASHGYVRDRARGTAYDEAWIEAHGTSTIAGHDHAHLTVYDHSVVTAVPSDGSVAVHGKRVRRLDPAGQLTPVPGRLEPAQSPDGIPL